MTNYSHLPYEDRKGVNLTPEEVYKINAIITPLVKNCLYYYVFA